MGLNKWKQKLDEIKAAAAIGAVILGSKRGQKILEKLDPASKIADSAISGIEAAKELIKKRT